MLGDAITVSILTPTRNRRAPFLPLAIASGQALRLNGNWEHIIVDDGSDDGAAAYLAELVARVGAGPRDAPLPRAAGGAQGAAVAA